MSQDRDTGASAVGGSSSGGSRGVGDYQSTTSGTNYGTDYEPTGYQRDTSIPVEERVAPATTQVHQERVVHREAQPVQQPVQQMPQQQSSPVNVAVAPERHDGVRWGPIWAGLLTALTLFLLLELLFYAFGWLNLDPGQNEPGSSRGLVTGILALIAFFVGGLIAGATALWKGLFSGLLHGFLVWALGVVAFIALTFFGASALLGSFGDLTSQLGVGPQQVQEAAEVNNAEADQAQDTLKDAAPGAFWGLLAPLAAAMAGGLIGSKIWPRKKDIETDTVRVDR